MSLGAKFAAQFRRPEGRLGAFAGWIMANRGSNRQRNDWTVELLEIAPGDRVLEFGCGPGLALAAAAARATSGRLVGIDHSSVMIEQARARLSKLGVRFGGHHVYLSAMLQAAAIALRARLWAIQHRIAALPAHG